MEKVHNGLDAGEDSGHVEDILKDEQLEEISVHDRLPDEPDVDISEDASPDCITDSECSDGNPCNGEETCLDGICRPGENAEDATPCIAPDGAPGRCYDGFCWPEQCGNEITDSTEECDDGNDISGDGCEPDCTYTCHNDSECSDDNPCTDNTCIEGGSGRLCHSSYNTSFCDDGDPCTEGDHCDGIGFCAGEPVLCSDPPPDYCSDGFTLVVYDSTGTCDGSGGEAVCIYGSSFQPCEFGCRDGECRDNPQQLLDINIYVDNFCNMNVVPAEVNVAPGNTVLLTYHNRSVDYEVDVWLSYGGGYLDLETGHSWADSFEWCTSDHVYTGYADISTACSNHRLLIHCL